jgi:hypothetical protein
MAPPNKITLSRKRYVCAALSGQIFAVICLADTTPILDHDALARCAGVTADDKRLACYDAVAGRLATAQTPGKPQMSTANSPAVSDENLFGLDKPIEKAARGPDSLRAEVVAISADSLGKVTMQLDNGQTWIFTDANALLRKGDAIVIKRAALGSYMMSTPSRRTYHVHRVN